MPSFYLYLQYSIPIFDVIKTQTTIMGLILFEFGIDYLLKFPMVYQTLYGFLNKQNYMSKSTPPTTKLPALFNY